MKITRVIYRKIDELITREEHDTGFTDIAVIEKGLLETFNFDDNVAIYELVKFGNGGRSVAIKNADGRLIVKYRAV